MKKALAFFLTLTVAWAFLVGLVILSMGVPETRTQWIMAVIVGPPLYVAAEAFSSGTFRNSTEKGSLRNPSPCCAFSSPLP